MEFSQVRIVRAMVIVEPSEAIWGSQQEKKTRNLLKMILSRRQRRRLAYPVSSPRLCVFFAATRHTLVHSHFHRVFYAG